jgi:hypothetical protein
VVAVADCESFDRSMAMMLGRFVEVLTTTVRQWTTWRDVDCGIRISNAATAEDGF